MPAGLVVDAAWCKRCSAFLWKLLPCRLARVAVHGCGVLRPHLAVLRLELHDQRGVLAEYVGLHCRSGFGAVGRTSGGVTVDANACS